MIFCRRQVFSSLSCILAGGLFLLSSCHKKSKAPDIILLSGSCKVRVNVKPKSAAIYVDGIKVGKGSIETATPCGEKRILVEKKGYEVFEEYLQVSQQAPLNLDLKMKKYKKGVQTWALSPLLIDQLKENKGAVNLKDPAAVEFAKLEAKKREIDGYKVVLPQVEEAGENSDSSEGLSFDGIDFESLDAWI